jgi:hypothetical protein
MNDDIAKFNEAQKTDIEKCGVTYTSYLPHITAWYIDLPSEPKITELQDISIALRSDINDLRCSVDSIALVELGRNGNALTITQQYPLCVDAIGDNIHTEL